ncbi:lyase family protein [Thermomonospora curvata]|uniref:3-carboxy-cis,cis-muconate cycloisomerase n=1 Tax=Thermomonospora curvata (strain ATCC 19995 / DSM 43183 / JCM 3096 / KCTC 9072 / NBRC 15933 / NCIMB 10081 / Henssen B9) TaxID=471852 RepID=D1A3W6_THECD|nr:lyase family protein [Thermomonospora curvata]ACY98019.1 3-carboxy-cis,cis-muconate cycloisomerase [Thermomonospora curvata DSM 43183]
MTDGLLSPVRAGSGAEAATGDEAWLRALLDAEIALARAQARLGLIPADAPAAVARAAGRITDAGRLAVQARRSGNPVVPIAAELRAATPHAHHGATSQDIADTAAMLVASRTRALILRDLDRTCAALAGLAERHRDTPMAGRTLGRPALPVTFGLKAAGWLLGCLQARRRLAQVRLPVQLGGAAGTMSGYGERAVELLPLYAAETGLDEPVLPWHTVRTPVVELGAALAQTAGALGKFATDVMLLSQEEVGEVAEPAAPGRGGSSAMPHKRNPVLSTLIRSAALQVPAQVAVLLTAQGGAAHERPAGEWHAEWQPLRECLRLTGGAAETAAELAAGLQVFPDRMRQALDRLVQTLRAHGSGTGLGSAQALVDRALAHYRTSGA